MFLQVVWQNQFIFLHELEHLYYHQNALYFSSPWCLNYLNIYINKLNDGQYVSCADLQKKERCIKNLLPWANFPFFFAADFWVFGVFKNPSAGRTGFLLGDVFVIMHEGPLNKCSVSDLHPHGASKSTHCLPALRDNPPPAVIKDLPPPLAPTYPVISRSSTAPPINCTTRSSSSTAGFHRCSISP